MSDPFIVLANAPIMEALFDVRTVIPKDFNVSSLADFHREIKSDFPRREVIVKGQASLKFEKGADPVLASVENKESGFLFKTENNEKIIQFRIDGFTFNKLKSYDSWESFSREAFQYWNRYVDIVKPTKITRVALRFINRIEIPESSPELNDYVKFLPNIPEGLPMSFYDFLIRTSMAEKDGAGENQANIIQTIDNKSIKPDIVPFILDIDVFRRVDLRANQNDALAEIFSSLRELKNKIFFNVITDKCKELFN